MSRAAVLAGAGAEEEEGGRRLGLSEGYLALVPLLAAYEVARRASGGGVRNVVELALSRALAPLGEHVDAARWTLLGALALAAFARVRLRGGAVGRSVLDAALEGLVGAIVLGPVLVVLVRLLGDSVAAFALPVGPPRELPGPPLVGLVFGASAWEELCFRVGGYSLFYLVGARATAFLGAPPRAARLSAEALALVASSLVFAAAHLEACTRWFGAGGEPYHSGLFAWRAFAGAVLAVLFRWRGLGVAGWTHGLFNVALVLGAGPAVLA